jgi:hypothetical protein
MKIPINLNRYQLFSALGIFILGLEFLAIILSVLGIFYWPILASYVFIGFCFLANLFFNNYKKNISLQIIVVSIFSFLAIIFFSHHAEPSVFSGRDQGSFSESAIQLSKNHKLAFETTASREFFKIYGTGLALNFPGFNYTADGKLITHFSLGYIAWLAIFYSFFGLAGFLIANGILFFLFTLSFFALLKINSSLRSAWLGLILILSTFVFSWFFKLTLSENLALGFIWFGILEFSLFLKYRDHFFFLCALATFLLLTFTRIEAWALLAMTGIVLFVFQIKTKNLFSTSEKKRTFWLLGIFLATFIANLLANMQFYRASLIGLLHSFSQEENGLNIIDTSAYLVKIFYYYNLLIFLIIGILGIIYFFFKKKFAILLPFFLLLPIFIYTIHPGISLDHPWMLRRFVFAIIPLGIFYTILIIDQLFRRNIHLFFPVFFLLTANLSVSLSLFSFSENKNLLLQAKNISENFSDTDLVLVDRLATGDGWSMLSGPLRFLYGKQAVYFFNPTDLKKIDQKKFTNIYLIVPDESLVLYEKFGLLKNLIFQKNYQMKRTNLLVPDLKKTDGFFWELPLESQDVTDGKIYLLKNDF